MVGTVSEHMNVYLDNAATTPCDQRVVEAMLPYWTEVYGNPSSTHVWGRRARQAVEDARARILELLGGSGQLLFTSGATEGNNLAMASVAKWINEQSPGRRRILYLATEHKSVVAPLHAIARVENIKCEAIPVLASGEMDHTAFRHMMDDSVGGVVVQLVNSETGVIQDVGRIAEETHAAGALCVSDMTQGLGKIPLNLDQLGIDVAIFNGHKIYGPKGIGGIYAKNGLRFQPLLSGGGQERSVRPGTENVPGVVGLAAAVDLATREIGPEMDRIASLREILWRRLRSVGGIRWNGQDAPVVATHLNVTIDGVQAQDLMLRVKDVAMSAGSACNASTNIPSEVLLAMGRTSEEAESTVRLTLGRFTKSADVNYAGEQLIRTIRAIRARA